jgi:hypothetical protein
MPLLRPENLSRLARVALLVFFAWLTGRFWHPYYGFTRFLQMDATSAATTLPELRDAPIFTYEYGYDGHYYAQLAARPAVNDPTLGGAIDSVGYRARRILLSWMAWAAGGGDPVAAVRAYAWLNLTIWAALAALLWRIFPCTGWRQTLAWGGILFSAGVLHSVRFGLTDLLALLFVAGAAALAERGWRNPAAALLGLGGLARETVLLGAVTLLPAGKGTRADWLRIAGRLALIAAPLALWLVYLRTVLGPTEPGLGNFMLPVAGWAEKWGEALRRLHAEPDHYLALTTLLAHLALTVQAAWLIVRRQSSDHWWRLGAVYGGLMLVLSAAVWEGHPGAATRILLPLALAFNVLAVRARASWLWLVFGNLSVLSGVLVLWQVPLGAHELAAGRSTAGSYVVHTDAKWYAVEAGRTQNWAWCARQGGIQIDFQPRTDGAASLQVAVKGFTPRSLEIKQGGRVLWRGDVGEQIQWISLPAVTVTSGRAQLEFISPAPPAPESPGGRELGFAVYGVKAD